VSLEHFKKQVLLLHSEQSTLDTLSSGFNDRYTVHCATSGSEALNTLGETQIDVIVSAQELPGMSGLDALREAKKRSPDTIGILLAGDEDNGLEAIVGDQEVFQIVRGEVSPDSLKNLIDGATRQARLLALAESANDMTASPDEPAAEHIVMETSENGSTIISDGTGRLPVLDAKKVSAAADVGSRGVDVLVLTQDEEFLGTVQESARGLHNVIYANTISQADEAISKNKIGVAVVDAAMVGAEVEKLTMHLRAQSPRLVAIVAGRRDDGEMLMDLINRGKVYRFLLKPVSPGRSRLAIEASVKHHLEAPDSAFKVFGGAAAPAKAAPKPRAKPQEKAQSSPAPAPKPASKPAPVARKEEPKPAPSPKAKAAPKLTRIEKSSTIVPNRNDALSPVDEGLSTAFGGDDSSFTDTVTGLISSVAKSFSSTDKKPDQPATPTPTPTPAPAAAAETPAPASSGGSLFTDPKILGIGATALVAVVAVGFWLFGGSNESVTADDVQQDTPVITDAAPAIETEAVVPAEPTVDDLIDQARSAESAGQIFNPPGSNAIELYLAALEVAPGDAAAEAGLADVIAHALGMAETALLESRTDDVVAALDRIALAAPDNSRLPFLYAQLAQLQFRSLVDDARAAIRESRFEDATSALDSARLLTAADASEIDTVADELSSALSAQRVGDVIAQANERLNEGKLIAPSNDNARFYYELALSNDPGNTTALQGLTVIAGRLALQAREQVDAGNFDIAEALLADVRRIDSSSPELTASANALSAAREREAEIARQAEEQRLAAEKAAREKAAAEKAAAEQKAAAEKAAAEQKAAAEKAAAEQKAAAEKAAAEQKAAAEKAAADKAAAERIAAARLAAEKLAADQVPAAAVTSTNVPANVPATTAAIEEPAAEEPAAEEPVAAEARVEDPVVEATQQEAATEAEPQPAPVVARSEAPVPASSLSRTKYVAPKYPRAAQRRGLTGWVDVVFTVDIDGTVSDVLVRDSQPGDTFVSSASTAVEKWEFEPVIENGVAVQKRAAVRMMFAME
jgi:TonB family protein